MHKRKIFAGFGGGVLVFFFLSYQFDKSVPGIYNFLFLTNLNHNIKKKLIKAIKIDIIKKDKRGLTTARVLVK